MRPSSCSTMPIWTRRWTGAMASKYRNAGQTCISANRIYVQDAVHDAFVEKLKAKIATLKLGRGTDAGVQMGPLIDARARGQDAGSSEGRAGIKAALWLRAASRRIWAALSSSPPS